MELNVEDMIGSSLRDLLSPMLNNHKQYNLPMEIIQEMIQIPPRLVAPIMDAEKIIVVMEEVVAYAHK